MDLFEEHATGISLPQCEIVVGPDAQRILATHYYINSASPFGGAKKRKRGCVTVSTFNPFILNSLGLAETTQLFD